MDAHWADNVGILFRSLGHEYRLKVLDQLRTGPLSADQLAARTGTSKPLLATHLVRLQRDNLISRQRAERGYIYSLSGDRALAIMDELRKLFGGNSGGINR